MANYKVLIGHDNPLVNLEDIVPQPKNGMVRVTRVYSTAGVVETTLHALFEWDLLRDGTAYQDILTQFGILDDLYAAVTIQTKTPLFDLARYNGMAQQPRIGEDGEWREFRPRGFVIAVNNLELLA